MDYAAQNTDTHLWPITTRDSDPFSDSIHVTASGTIGISVGGHVIVKPLRSWHELAAADLRAAIGPR